MSELSNQVLDGFQEMRSDLRAGILVSLFQHGIN